MLIYDCVFFICGQNRKNTLNLLGTSRHDSWGPTRPHSGAANIGWRAVFVLWGVTSVTGERGCGE